MTVLRQQIRELVAAFAQSDGMAAVNTYRAMTGVGEKEAEDEIGLLTTLIAIRSIRVASGLTHSEFMKRNPPVAERWQKTLDEVFLAKDVGTGLAG